MAKPGTSVVYTSELRSSFGASNISPSISKTDYNVDANALLWRHAIDMHVIQTIWERTYAV